MVIPSDEELSREADYCIRGFLTDSRLIEVQSMVWGAVPYSTLNLPLFQRSELFLVGTEYIVFLKQEFSDLNVLSHGAREIKDGHVVTTETISPFSRWSAETNSVAFPIESESYAQRVRQEAEEARQHRHEQQRKAWLRILDRDQYLEEGGAAPLDILNGVLWDVHVDDVDTLSKMTAFIQTHPESKFMHARGRFVRVIAMKNYTQGFHAIRLEAQRNSRQGQNWASERDAIHALSNIGAAEDIELLRSIILVQGERHHGTLLRAAFPAFADIIMKHYGGDHDRVSQELLWVQQHAYPWYKEAIARLSNENTEHAPPEGRRETRRP